MKCLMMVPLFALLAFPLVADTPKGTVPRSAADKYAAHAEASGAALGATLLAPKEVHKAFSTDLTRCCLVVEVALYPSKDKALAISPDDFVLRLGNTETALRPTSARLLAAQLQKKNSTTTSITPVGEAHVGYESGIDPITGQRVHGVEAGGGVGVGIGGSQPGPASTARDRDVMELELSEKALPEDTVSAPVAGYLYFSLAKDDKKAPHQLEYTLNGQKLSLKLD